MLSAQASFFRGIFLGIICALFAAACAAPEVRYEPVEVRVPVLVPCAVPAPAEPVWSVDALPPGADEFQIAKALRAERPQRQQYLAELKAAMLGCTSRKETP